MGRISDREQDAAPQSVLADAQEQRLSWEDVCLQLDDLKAKWQQSQTQHSAGCPKTPCPAYEAYTDVLMSVETEMQAIQDDPIKKHNHPWQLLRDMKKATVASWIFFVIKGALTDDTVHAYNVAASSARDSLTKLFEELLEECK